jgi:hypothetical protein
MPALIARHNIEPLREQIDYLALSLIAPLGAYYCDYFGHKNIANCQLPIADWSSSLMGFP